MKAKIKRFTRAHSLPMYATGGAAAFDLISREKIVIFPREVGYVPLNVAIAPPEGYFLLIAARSSTHKKGLLLANGMGIGDPDFCGDGDEYVAAYYNFTHDPVMIEAGERIAQGMFVQFMRAEWDEVDSMNGKMRGGFGSTGK